MCEVNITFAASEVADSIVTSKCKYLFKFATSSCRCAQACQAHGVDFLDAPISGGPQKARDGTLTIMCGGAQEAYNKVEPIMKTMGSHIRLLGGHGAGTAAKLVSKLRVVMLPSCKVYASNVH